MKELKLKINDQEAIGKVEKMGPTLWVSINGKTFTYEPESSSKKRRGQSAQTSSDQIVAPMPGKITKILVAADDVVEEGQVLITMEAMKMEYNLKAGMSGEVLEISCQEGQQVVLGKVLLQLK